MRVEQEELKIPMRETFAARASAMGRHVKQSGGHGQYAVCNIEVEPLDRGAGFEFVDKVVGGAVPRQFIPSVEKGIRNQLERGVFAGFPMVDVRVTLVDGKAHSVDCCDMAFQMAGALAIKEAAASKAAVALLEPLDLVTVTVGEDYLGAVMTDLSGRRGQVLGSDVGGPPGDRAGLGAAGRARSVRDRPARHRHGSGTFSREFHGYELLPASLLDRFAKK